jgi:XTP/dITP diphosphohydrolase
VVDPASGCEWVVEGRLQGKILTEPRGAHGFGYDPLFYVPGLGQTLAELSAEEKNRISHRGRAVQALLEAWERESNACGCGE